MINNLNSCCFSLMVEQAEEHTGKLSLPHYIQPPRGLMKVLHPTASALLKITTESLLFFPHAPDLISEETCDGFKLSSRFLPKELESSLMKASNNVSTS